jgi:serine/threonine protein kinase
MLADLEPGSAFGRYRVERLIARGGMGSVYLAAETATARPVALKLVRSELAADPQFRARFERESRLTAELDHPHLVPLYAAGECDGALFCASRFIDGIDLEILLAERGSLHPRWAALVIAQVGAALGAAHERGLVHRDVKPANVLLESRAGEPHAYLADFGLSKHVSSRSGLTRTGMWVGTIDYAAPEQIQAAAVGPAADIYALGCVLYEMLAGQVIFPHARMVDKIGAHMVQSPPPLPDAVPEPFNDVVARATAKRAEDRYATAEALARDAQAAARQAPPPDAPLLAPGSRAPGPIDRGAPTAG